MKTILTKQSQKSLNPDKLKYHLYTGERISCRIKKQQLLQGRHRV
jgi:hypothetical protein